MANVVKKTTHVIDAQARLPGHLSTATNLHKLVELLANRMQGLEDELDLLLNNVTDLTTVVGVQLDTIGEILNVTRIVGESDVAYRIRLQAETAKLAKSGEPETVIEVFLALVLANSVLLSEFFPATIELTAFVDDDTFDLIIDQAIIDAMDEVIAAGVGTILQIVDENHFFFGDAADADANGDIALDVDHGFGDEVDVDTNGNIAEGVGKGGNWARLLTGIQIINTNLVPLQWYAPFREPIRIKQAAQSQSGFIVDSPFPFP